MVEILIGVDWSDHQKPNIPLFDFEKEARSEIFQVSVFALEMCLYTLIGSARMTGDSNNTGAGQRKSCSATLLRHVMMLFRYASLVVQYIDDTCCTSSLCQFMLHASRQLSSHPSGASSRARRMVAQPFMSVSDSCHPIPTRARLALNSPK